MADRATLLAAARTAFRRLPACDELTTLQPWHDTLTVDTTDGLAGGRLGVALFTAALDRVTDETTHTHRWVSHLFDTPAATLLADRSLGAAGGVGSLVYGLSVVSTLTDDDRYARRGVRLLEAISRDRIDTATRADVATGLAGLIHAALRCYETHDAFVGRRLAARCGERLLAIRKRKWGYRVWDTNPSDDTESFTTGFAHGAAGIAAALRRLSAATGRPAFAEAATHAHAFEETFYSPATTNWQANWSGQPAFPTRWCFGAVGVGHGRLCSWRHLPAGHDDRPAIDRDLERVAAREWELADCDTLCDGTCGVIDLLLELSRRRGVPVRDRADSLLDSLLARADDRGRFAVPFGEYEQLRNPSLFDGVAGVGYTLLRRVDPAIPSVLRFE